MDRRARRADKHIGPQQSVTPSLRAVNHHQDIQIRLCERGEFAELSISAKADPRSMSAENLLAAVEVAGIKITASVQRRVEQIAASFHQQPRKLTKIIATSSNPVHGEDGYLKWESEFARVTKPATKRSRPSGCSSPVNHYAGLHYVDVKAGDHVATIVEPTPGIDGIDVCGQLIKAKPGVKCDVRVDQSLQVDDAGRVITTREGTLQFERNVLRVDDVLNISGCVDFTTGNIHVNGSVVVREHVRAMFTIEASLDVTVLGLVEAATIICKRDFHCRRGMAAKGRGRLEIGRDAETGYLNDATAIIKRDLILHREAIDCQIEIDGQLRGESATVIGGTLIVKGACRLATLGSRGCKPTIIQPGGSLNVLRTIHQGVILRLPTANGQITEAALRDSVKGPVKLERNAEGQWCFATGNNLTMPLAAIADLTLRKAA